MTKEEQVDPEWKVLFDKFEPLRERMKAKGCHLGLHVGMYPRYQVYYGYYHLFTEADPVKVLARAEEYVASIEAGKPSIKLRNFPKDY